MQLKTLFAAALTLAVTAAPAAAGSAPALDSPLNIIVGYTPGGTSDRVARLVGDKLAAALGTPVIVENRTGAGGRIAAQHVARATAEDNVLLLGNPALMVVVPLVHKEPGYDAYKDLTPVSLVASYRFGLAVPASSSIKSIGELKPWIQQHKDSLNLGVPATGSLPHFFGLMLGQALGEPAEIIGYRGSGPLVTELGGGHIPFAIDNYDTLEPLHAAGKIRILAVSGDTREAAHPDIPTFVESGINLTGTGWNGLFAAASMPADKVQALGRAVAEVMRDESLQKTLRDARMEPMIADAAQSQALLDEFRQQWDPVIRKSGFQAD